MPTSVYQICFYEAQRRLRLQYPEDYKRHLADARNELKVGKNKNTPKHKTAFQKMVAEKQTEENDKDQTP